MCDVSIHSSLIVASHTIMDHDTYDLSFEIDIKYPDQSDSTYRVDECFTIMASKLIMGKIDMIDKKNNNQQLKNTSSFLCYNFFL